jgi:hypothetical protein
MLDFLKNLKQRYTAQRFAEKIMLKNHKIGNRKRVQKIQIDYIEQRFA